MQIRRIGVMSAFKVGLVVNAILFSVMGLCVGVLQLAAVGTLFSPVVFIDGTGVVTRDTLSALSAASLMTLCALYVVLAVSAAIVGGISFALWAVVYNLTARWIGGVEVQLAPAGLAEFEFDPRR